MDEGSAEAFVSNLASEMEEATAKLGLTPPGSPSALSIAEPKVNVNPRLLSDAALTEELSLVAQYLAFVRYQRSLLHTSARVAEMEYEQEFARRFETCHFQHVTERRHHAEQTGAVVARRKRAVWLRARADHAGAILSQYELAYQILNRETTRRASLSREERRRG